MLNGLLLVDKPVDWTSHDVVSKVRRLAGQSSVGHSGTLDPFASGLMVLLLGHGTKLSDYILSKDKTYAVEVCLGVETDTLDRTGQVVKTLPVEVCHEDIQRALGVCQGEVDLPVPRFSAIKVNGQKLYNKARSGQEFEAPLKRMHFYDLKFIDYNGHDRIRVQVSCSKGSYIRSWAAWLGRELGCGAMAQELRRLSSLPFDVKAAVTLGEIEQRIYAESSSQKIEPQHLKEAFIPLSEALPDLRRVSADARDERLFLNGQISKDLATRLVVDLKEAQRSQRAKAIQVFSLERRELIGIIEALPEAGLKIRRVFKS